MTHARSGNWATNGALPLPRSADNRTIGILGLGRIGKAIATKLAPFNPTILYYGRNKQDVPFQYFDDLTAMAQACDTLICVAPGDASTHHLINREVLDAIGPDGYLINVGRGSTVNETALIAALTAGTLGGAGLDVFEKAGPAKSCGVPQRPCGMRSRIDLDRPASSCNAWVLSVAM